MLSHHCRLGSISEINRRSVPTCCWIRWIFLAILVFLNQPVHAAAPAGGQRPNILFVFCDDHAYQAISAYREICPYNIPLNQTPNIDRLAREGMRFDKRWMYEETLRTPLIVRWPKAVRPGSVNKDIVSNVDFAETFLDLAGAEAPADMQGRSLVPILKGQTPADWRKSFYYHYYEFPGPHDVRRHYGVTDGRFKLIRFYEPDVDQWEFFDLQRDPYELTSVYGNPEYAKEQARMEQELKRLRKELEVPEEDPPETYLSGPDRYQKAVQRIGEKLKQLETK